jgi:hypothetical protein
MAAKSEIGYDFFHQMVTCSVRLDQLSPMDRGRLFSDLYKDMVRRSTLPSVDKAEMQRLVTIAFEQWINEK